jgi:two-component system, NarL family, sensor kinase
MELCNFEQNSGTLDEIVSQKPFRPRFHSEEVDPMWIISRHQTKLKFGQSHSQLESLIQERTVALQVLSRRLLRVQDEERRRVARDLHDSAGQLLTALKMSVALLQRKLDKDEEIREELSAIARLADQALQEIRTTSFLLHPPLLDEVGFHSAARWYVEGFAERSGLKVRRDFTPATERLPDVIETALFRVLQESLTNVHRHSGTSEVVVRFRQEAQVVTLEVRDFGRGIPGELLTRMGDPSRHSGVGLAGMRERLNELNGGFEIEAANPGTRLLAVVPLVAQAASAHAG